MPVVNFEQYCNMLDTAQKKNYAYPAINVTSTETANAALKGFADAKSDGIIQLSTGGGQFAAGLNVADMVLGSISIAQHVHLLAEKYNIFIALHTDHCQPQKVDSYIKPLMAETKRRRDLGLPNLFNSHMFDGSVLPLKENVAVSKKLLAECAALDIILEVEIGVVGGEEDGMDNEGVAKDKLYTTSADMLYTFEQLSEVKKGRFMLAATFGNVHGVYKPGNVKLQPKILRDGQKVVTDKHGAKAIMDLVFHGGSGSEIADIHETLEYGVVKMNVDTDTQYAFTRPVVDHIMKNYDGVLKIEGEVGNKKVYDPRSYLKAAEKNMAARVEQACNDLKSTGKTIFSA
ncbi:MAG: class II fructose-bisphosphate aldolase [Gammaproteobacteria bacterium]|nr:class II fructose-bisphosphate aldolase [Gammaproteobacteria bacterium]